MVLYNTEVVGAKKYVGNIQQLSVRGGGILSNSSFSYVPAIILLWAFVF
jgi:hypothetical protein